MTLLPPTSAAPDQTHILRAFVTLMNAENQTMEATKALEVLAEAARVGAMVDAVKTIAHG